MKKSARKGGFWIKSLAKGVYRVSISKNGYISQETSVAAATGEMAILNIELVKAN
ncbi:MAG: carboxypeptidase regulatory-like domain-containing protein [Chloroflexia bacterium]|nr:carboxypeptidase regulatory-like domain-containing protein [Chloroflexia bacterium]